jgi:hypothetical protein
MPGGSRLASIWKRIPLILRIPLYGIFTLFCLFILLRLTTEYMYYEKYGIYSQDGNDEVVVEEECGMFWCGVRVLIHTEGLSSPFIPVLVYVPAYINEFESGQAWCDSIEPQVTWRNERDLEISLSYVDQILYKKYEAGGRKISYNIGRTACPEISHTGLLYGLRGVFWTWFGPDYQCLNSIKIIIDARNEMAHGADKAAVWKKLNQQGVSDQDIWRIGL